MKQVVYLCINQNKSPKKYTITSLNRYGETINNEYSIYKQWILYL